jgi:predicted phosphoribosyltransferase
MRYADRAAAGQALAKHLGHLAGRDNVVILGLPRGGVPVAAEIAQQLKLPLDVLVVRKLGVPWHRELAMGAIAPGGVRILQDRVIRTAGVSERQIDETSEREEAELERQQRVFRGRRPPLDIKGKTAVLVDDGLATGASMLAAIGAAKALGAGRVIAVAPVGAPDTIKRLRGEADEVVVDQTPRGFGAVGQWYDNFRQVSDDEVLKALER